MSTATYKAKKSTRRWYLYILASLLVLTLFSSVGGIMAARRFAKRWREQRIRERLALYDVYTLRSQIELFRSEHGGKLPNATLSDLVTQTEYKGHAFGPYMLLIPPNMLTGNASIKISAGRNVAQSDVTPGQAGGWIYSPATGEIRLDCIDHWQDSGSEKDGEGLISTSSKLSEPVD